MISPLTNLYLNRCIDVSQMLINKMDLFQQMVPLNENERQDYVTMNTFFKASEIAVRSLSEKISKGEGNAIHQIKTQLVVAYHLAAPSAIFSTNVIGRKAIELTGRTEDPQTLALKEECISIGILALCLIAAAEDLKIHGNLTTELDGYMT